MAVILNVSLTLNPGNQIAHLADDTGLVVNTQYVISGSHLVADTRFTFTGTLDITLTKPPIAVPQNNFVTPTTISTVPTPAVAPATAKFTYVVKNQLNAAGLNFDFSNHTGDFAVTGNITATGNIIGTGPTSLIDAANMACNVFRADVSAKIPNVIGDTQFGGNILSHGNIVSDSPTGLIDAANMACNVLRVDSGASISSLIVPSTQAGPAKFIVDGNGNVTAVSYTGIHDTGLLTVDGVVTFNNQLNAGNVTLSGTLTCIGVTDLGGLNCAGINDTGGLTVAGVATFNNNMNAGNITCSGSISCIGETDTGPLSCASLNVGPNGSTFGSTINVNGHIVNAGYYMGGAASSQRPVLYDPSGYTIAFDVSSGGFTFPIYSGVRSSSYFVSGTNAKNLTLASGVAGPTGWELALNDNSNNAYGIYVDVFSDARLKENIRDTSVDALAALLAVPVRAFDWTAEYVGYMATTNRELTDAELATERAAAVPYPVAIGLVAQEVIVTVPEGARSSNSGMKQPEGSPIPDDALHIDDTAFLPYLIRAVQQLSAQNAALEARIAALEGV